MKLSLEKINYVLLGFLVFFIPMEEAVGVGEKGSGTLLRYIGLMILPFFIFDILRKKKYHRWSIEQSLFFCFYIWVLLSMFWTYDLYSTQKLSFTYTSLFIFVWLIVSYADTLSKISILTFFYLAGCLFSLFYGQSSLLGTPYVDTGGYLRYAGGGLDQNDCSFILNLGGLLSFMQIFLSRSRIRSFVFFFLALIMAWGVLLTESRAGFIGLVILWLGVAHFVRTRISQNLFWLLFVPFLVGVVFYLLTTDVWMRVSEGLNALTFQTRQSAWLAGLTVWKDVPFQGVGAGAFIAATIYITKDDSLVAHNTFVSVLVELGIVGVSLFCSIFYFLISAGRIQLLQSKSDSREEMVFKYFLGFLVFLVFLPAFLSLTFEYKKMLWFVVGLSIASRRALVYERTA